MLPRLLAVAAAAALLAPLAPDALAGTAPARLVAPHAPAADCLARVNGVDVAEGDLATLRAALASGRLTSRRLVQAYLARIARIDRGPAAVNAVRVVTRDALAQADASDRRRRAHRLLGPLDGIPVLLKDNIGTRDATTTAGSIALAANLPRHEAVVTRRLRAAGAVVLAKTNLSEFANWVDLTMPNGYSSLGGQVRNPYDGGDPSGSSSGSGAGESLGLAALAVGTETSGSILSPSDVEALVGVKPTVGLVSRTGVIPLAATFDTAGPMARTVSDAATLLDAMAGADPEDVPQLSPPGRPLRLDAAGGLHRGALRGTRLGWSTFDVPSGAQGALFLRALDDLRQAGATLVETDDLTNTSIVGLTELGVIPNEFKRGINDYLAHEAGPGLPVSDLTGIVLYNQQHPDRVKYGQSLLVGSDATTGTDDPVALAQRSTTVVSSRVAIDSTLQRLHLDAYLAPGASYANIGAAAGYPTVIVPSGLADGRPMGLSFLGHAWTERNLLALAYDYEQRTHRRVPPTSVNRQLLAGVCGRRS